MDEPLSKNHYINVGKKGTFSPGNNPIFNSTPKEIDDLFAELKSSGTSKILLYFHGGLVPAHSGLQTANRIVRYVKSGSDVHPICFVWETGLTKTIYHNLDTIATSKFFKKILIKILKVTGGNLGIEHLESTGGAKGLGGFSDKEIEEELLKDSPFEDYQISEGDKSANVLAAEAQEESDLVMSLLSDQLEAELEEEILSDFTLIELANSEKPGEEQELLNPDVFDSDEEGAKGIISTAKLIASALKITVAIIKRHLKKRNHDFYPTVIEEALREFYVADIGNWVWGNMKKKAAGMWSESEFQGDYKNWPVGSYFLTKLNDFQKNNQNKVSIDLVGHSAGSIVICELLRKVSEQNISIDFRHLIFMAPAVRCDLFDETVIKNKDKFLTFRCFTMEDEIEKKDRMLKFIYPRSLLYLISGILEDESDAIILGLQRHIVGNVPYRGDLFDRVIDFLKTEGNLVFAITDDQAEDGLKTGSMSHGGFDDDGEITLESIVHIIKS